MQSPLEKVEAVRAELRNLNLDAVFIPSADAHDSEYPPELAQKRAYISGFTGSAGVAIITTKKALLWTDGRYFTQAETQLDLSVWTLMKMGLPSTPSIKSFLKDCEHIMTVGYDPELMTFETYSNLELPFPKKFVETPYNLIDKVRRADNALPAEPFSIVYHLPLKFSGATVQDKIVTISKKMDTEQANMLLLTMLDDIAWATNLRGKDTHDTPIFAAYMTVQENLITLYTNEKRLDSSALEHIKENDIQLKPYGQIFEDIASEAKKIKIWIDSRTNMKLYSSIPKENMILKTSPVQELKAVKNTVELEGFKICHINDAIAKCAYLMWLEQQEFQNLNEFEAGVQLATYRSYMDYNKGVSFDTISSIGENSAVIHYKPPDEGSKQLSEDIYLVDSEDNICKISSDLYVRRNGTTDVTRTVHLGEPSSFQKKLFTLVLKGHLALIRQKFTKNTRGSQLDAIARQFLWNEGFNYMHGTGHGVGHFLGVHEGPQTISPVSPKHLDPYLEPGMIVSIEPGVYLPGKFGVRIENLVFVKKVSNDISQGEIQFLEFENLTLIPYQQKMIDLDLLSDEEIQQINDYHTKIYKILTPELKKYSKYFDLNKLTTWLQNQTKSIKKINKFL